MFPYKSLIIPALAALGATFVMWLWHNASTNRTEAKESKKETAVVIEQKAVVIQDAKDAGDNSGKYIEALKKAKDENNDLRTKLSNGTVKLRISQSDAATANVSAHNSAAAKAEADANYAADRERILHLIDRSKELDAWSASCWEWVNRKNAKE